MNQLEFTREARTFSFRLTGKSSPIKVTGSLCSVELEPEDL